MTPAALLRRLTDQSVTLWAEGDRLRYRGSKGSLSATDLDALRANKPALLSSQPADLAEALEAGIVLHPRRLEPDGASSQSRHSDVAR